MNAPWEIVSPLAHDHWNQLVLAAGEYSFFHSQNWARVLSESYGYSPLYFALFDGGNLLSLVPIMEITSLLTGRRAVSLPFTDYCDPIFTKESSFPGAADFLIGHGERAQWKYLELRSSKSLAQEIPCYARYHGHVLSLQQSPDKIYSKFRESTKRNIKKAAKLGVRVEISASGEALAEFRRLNYLTRRMHGLPPQPDQFFNNIHKYVLSENLGVVTLAAYEGRYIAGAVYFHLGDRAVYKYGASNRDYQEVRANNLVMWETIRWYAEQGFASLCFGRTEPQAAGLNQFKAGWGTEERDIMYYRYDMGIKRFVGNSAPAREPSYKIFSTMPLALAKIAGQLLYRHVG